MASIDNEVDVQTCQKIQEETKQALRNVADEIDEGQKKLDAAKLSFATTGATGGILTAAGLVLSPFTAGASLGLAVAGGVVTGLSAAGSISSFIADEIITSEAMKKAEKQLRKCAQKSKSIEQKLPELIAILNKPEKEELRRFINRLPSGLLNSEIKQFILQKLDDPIDIVLTIKRPLRIGKDLVANIKKLVVLLSKSSEAGKKLSGLAAKVGATANAAKAGGTAAHAAKTTGGVVVKGGMLAAGLALDLASIVYYSVKVHKKKPSEIAENIREAASCLA